MQLFEEIDRAIGADKSSYGVMSIGLYPEIAIYNGFYALDSYQRNYALSYNRQFRKIIEGELAKSDNLRGYFDGWGSRCYAFTSATGKAYLYSKHSDLKIEKPALDYNQFKSMGGRIIFSAVPIIDEKLELLNSFERIDSYWKIYVYEVL